MMSAYNSILLLDLQLFCLARSGLLLLDLDLDLFLWTAPGLVVWTMLSGLVRGLFDLDNNLDCFFWT